MIKAVSLNKTIGGRTLFHDLSFVLPEYGLVMIYGNNGSGKTTLLLLLDLLDPKFSGDLFINGDNAKKLLRGERDELREKALLYVGPHGDFLENLTLKENFALFSLPCELAFGDRKPSEISGGEYQKATLLLLEEIQKEIILLDEGTAFVDQEGLASFCERLKTLSQRKLIVLASPKPLPVEADLTINLDHYHD
jgi:ABC-type lipoprotein export system ATPase subunit